MKGACPHQEKKQMKDKHMDKLFSIFVGLVVTGCVLAAVYLPILLFTWMFHADNTADLSQVEYVIAINQEEYDRASARIANVTEGDADFRLNADTPVASMVEAQLTFAKRLVRAKVRKRSYLASIITRCNGPWAPAVWMFDSVSCGAYRAM